MTTEADRAAWRLLKDISASHSLGDDDLAWKLFLADGAEREAAGVALGRREMREEAAQAAETSKGYPTYASEAIRALPDHRPAPTEGDAT